MTNDVKKTNLVGNCEHTREGLELARWEKKTHPGHCPVDNDKDRFPFLSCRPTGHKEVDLLVSLARSERMGKWGAGVRKNDIKGISWEFFISPAFGRVKMIRHTRALPKWFSLRGNIGRRGVGPAQDCRTRISDFRDGCSNVTESGLTSSCWRFVCWCCSNYFSCLTGYFTAKQK